MNRRLFSQRYFPPLAATLLILTAGSTTSAQGIEELFGDSDDTSLIFFQDPSGTEEKPADPFYEDASDERENFESLPAPSKSTQRSKSESQRSGGDVHSPSDLRLTGQSGSQAERRRAKAMQLRQARALAEMRSRMARLEAQRWGLRPSLRPSWPADPMTASRSPANITYIVPVYVWGP
ncbi:malate synthase [Allorhodopirellula solitaria]|uniref:Uncharacterized protein n=1 Tax=Allorhodopirellula solitaria TaxID=2527987 RepID=A0A5C5YH28_9BACT|nr:malate synthase [Allorhodopirellula solitaria]TWT74409.1 hypothetical protein CA85_12980 [Allorhodopirellula solitaria]